MHFFCLQNDHLNGLLMDYQKNIFVFCFKKGLIYQNMTIGTNWKKNLFPDTNLVPTQVEQQILIK